MRIKILAAVLASASLFAANAHAQTEIQWWHSMTGALGDKLNEIANGFNASQKDYKVVPVFKGTYPESMTAAIASFRAGNAPHILQVFEVGTATMMAAKGAIVPVAKVMKDANEPFDPKAYLPAVAGYYTDSKGNMLSYPVQQLDGAVLHQQGHVQESRARPEQGAQDLEGTRRRGRQDQGLGPGLRLHHRLAVLDAHRELQRLAQRAHRHQGKRHGGPGHRVQDQLAAAREAHRDAGRHGEERPVHLCRPHQPGRSQVLQRRMRDAHLLHGRAGQHPAATPSSTGR